MECACPGAGWLGYNSGDVDYRVLMDSFLSFPIGLAFSATGNPAKMSKGSFTECHERDLPYKITAGFPQW